MAVDLNEKGINKDDPGYQGMLENLQANILKSHARDNARLLFLKFTATENAVKAWIKTFISECQQKYVVSAMDQMKDSKKWNEVEPYKGKIVVNFYLSAKGYEKIGLKQLDKLVKNGNDDFANGMKSAGVKNKLSDPEPGMWETKYNTEIHAMILLADNDTAENRIDTELQSIKQALSNANIASIIAEEAGKGLKRDDLDIEHFGYADGISQPRYFKENINKAGANTDKWDAIQPLNIILVKDPFTNENDDNYGSFLVYRKLEQDVEGFKRRITQLSENLILNQIQQGKITKEDFAGAMAVGRFKDGTPLVTSEIPTNEKPVLNNFNYKGDGNAKMCPFHSHIRKTNPRGQGQPIIPKRFVTRRGIPYGRPASNDDKGLLFMCFQSNLKKQFNFIQQTWVNNPKFNPRTFGLGSIFGRNPGIDPLIGQGNKGSQGWPKEYDKRKEVDFDFAGFIKMRGGEYFFAPSIGFLKNIDNL
jgi:Dyp-type peroxidase family